MPLLVELNLDNVSLIKIEPSSAEVIVEKKRDTDVPDKRLTVPEKNTSD